MDIDFSFFYIDPLSFRNFFDFVVLTWFLKRKNGMLAYTHIHTTHTNIIHAHTEHRLTYVIYI